jgi:transposase
MEVIYDRVAGLDVHKKTVVACVRTMKGGKITRECRTFETTTVGLLALLAWLTESGCSHVAMEATGIYWVPVWGVLSDGAFELVLANAAHIKNVPGRKTDVNDATWIADLLACGLIKASFVPGENIRNLRALLRTRKQMGREQTSHVQRIQKTLEAANIKLDSVISDIMGVSGRRMIEEMIKGVRDPQKLAALADKRLRASKKTLYDALHGRLTDHHRFLLRLHLDQYDALAASIQKIDQEVNAQIARMDEEAKARGQLPFRALIELLCTIPGVSVLGATWILAEIGRDMSRFPTAGHLVSWAGLCPGKNESAGKSKSSRLRKGGCWLKPQLVQCGWAASRKTNSYYKAQFHHLKGRKGPNQAVCAVAASILTAAYHMLKDGVAHEDLGANHFDRRKNENKVKRHVNSLASLGYRVELYPLSEVA